MQRFVRIKFVKENVPIVKSLEAKIRKQSIVSKGSYAKGCHIKVRMLMFVCVTVRWPCRLDDIAETLSHVSTMYNTRQAGQLSSSTAKTGSGPRRFVYCGVLFNGLPLCAMYCSSARPRTFLWWMFVVCMCFYLQYYILMLCLLLWRGRRIATVLWMLSDIITWTYMLHSPRQQVGGIFGHKLVYPWLENRPWLWNILHKTM